MCIKFALCMNADTFISILDAWMQLCAVDHKWEIAEQRKLTPWRAPHAQTASHDNNSRVMLKVLSGKIALLVHIS